SDLSPQRLAEVCRMSPRSLSSLLVRSVGMTLRSYAAVARLDRAKFLLAQEDGLVKQVAYRCGFKGTAAFGAAFRKALGMTPQEYRQQHQPYPALRNIRRSYHRRSVSSGRPRNGTSAQCRRCVDPQGRPIAPVARAVVHPPQTNNPHRVGCGTKATYPLPLTSILSSPNEC